MEHDLQAVIHDLRVHQEEIRVQNEQLVDAQRALEQSRDRYASLYDFAPISYITLDRNGIVHETNVAGCRLLGLERAHILQYPFAQWLSGPSRLRLAQEIKLCIKHGAGEWDAQIVNARGVTIPVRISARVEDAGKGSPRVRAVITDLTDTLRAEQERRRADEERQEMAVKERTLRALSEAKDSFLAILSHELRTPLTPILAGATALARRSDLSAEVAEFVGMVQRNIAQEVRLIDDLLDLTRAERGKLQVKPEPMDLHAAIGDALEICRADFDAGGLTLHADLRAADSVINGDPARLRQVFWNVFKNAAKFTPAGGDISVRTENTHGMIRVSIRDTGVGVPGDAVSTIFEPFKQVAGGRPGSGGLGLGLAVCRILVEAHGGRVWCESPGAGQGATFYIELAAVPNGRLASVPVQPSQAQERCAQRILLVDDHPDTLQILGRVLRLEGHEVTTATSVSDVRKLPPAAFDVVISDIGLGDGSGLEVMSHFSNTPVHGIAVSGYGTTADVQKSLAAGFSSHLTKPVSIDALLDAIREVRDAEATEAERPVRSKQNQSRER